ncbi:alpha/beta fold hydrolase [Hyphococcus lacteus]|uniref:Alpha/beta hydrolase n=1 Tax=Hyphococcus lacteus TaxID=3143536 RepID=A0ABV3Z4K9_9PROT
MKKLIVLLVLLAAGAGGYYFLENFNADADITTSDTYLKPADRIVEIAGAKVRVREEGPVDAPVILLIHGFTHSLETWDGWAEALKPDFRVIRYDLLGHGLTGPDPQERYSPVERASFIGDVMDALKIDHAFIAGNSLGGLAAWRFAATHSERLDGLILISPGAYPFGEVGDEPAPIPPMMKAYLLTAPEAGVRASAELIYADDSKITDERVKVMGDMIRFGENGSAMIKSLEEFTLPDPTADLSNVRTPTLIMWGEGDILIPIAHGAMLKKVMPNATLLTYPGVGHAAQEESPEQTVADAAEFIKSLLDENQTEAP